MWSIGGNPAVQNYYKQGRALTQVAKSDIEGICQCGYLSLKPHSGFEARNGGLTVKRSAVAIIDDEGNTVQRLSRKGINSYCSCNACANKWC